MKIDEALYQLKQNIKMHEIEGTTSNQNEREKLLLDYITNLQEENEKLKKQNIKLYKKDIKEINKLKLKQTKEVFDKLAYLINTNETCSYRFLIYDLLGFQKKDYIDLISGLVITNMLVDYQDYKSRIDKTNNKLTTMFDNGNEETILDDLLELENILQGSDKNE